MARHAPEHRHCREEATGGSGQARGCLIVSVVCFCCSMSWLSFILLTCACTRRSASQLERGNHRDMTVDATEKLEHGQRLSRRTIGKVGTTQRQ